MRQQFLLLVTLILLAGSSCRKAPLNMWQTLCVEEGQHAYRPLDLNGYKEFTRQKYSYQFDPFDTYDLDTIDQCDWLKLGGHSLWPTTNHKDALMVGMRYDTEGFWWLVPYYHKNEETDYGPAPCSGYYDQELDPDFLAVQVWPGETFEVEYQVWQPNAMSVLIITPNGQSNLLVQFDVPISKTREINPWFGGNRKAPNRLCLYRRLEYLN